MTNLSSLFNFFPPLFSWTFYLLPSSLVNKKSLFLCKINKLDNFSNFRLDHVEPFCSPFLVLNFLYKGD
ncbi:MAG: hypothetical protein B5M54_07700 [Candidatus Aminicenantes bacterium 4484_214]|nr:MAG: hypothetical protein B5M54_07700 [Candidatus Aminicenantes bacterium 4484_214]